MKKYTDLSWLDIDGGEQVQSIHSPSIYLFLPGILKWWVLVFLGVVHIGATHPEPPATFAEITILAGFLLSLRHYLRWKWTHYVITTDSVYRKSGFRRNVKVAPADQIQNIDTREGVIGKLLSFGTITIYTAGTNRSEIRLEGIYKPYNIQNQIPTNTTPTQAKNSTYPAN